MTTSTQKLLTSVLSEKSVRFTFELYKLFSKDDDELDNGLSEIRDS